MLALFESEGRLRGEMLPLVLQDLHQLVHALQVGSAHGLVRDAPSIEVGGLGRP